MVTRVLAATGVLGVLIGAALVLVPSRPAVAAINPTINFQGKLVNTNGTNIPDGTYNIEFQLYTAGNGCVGGGTSPCGGGSPAWTEDHIYGSGSPDNRVTVTDGVFQVELGSITSLPAIFNGNNIWLSINLSDTTTRATFAGGDGEMLPFIHFTSTPYAFNSDLLDGLDSSAFAQLSPGSAQSGFLSVTGNVTSGATVAAATSLQAPLVDTASAGALNIGTGTATSVTIGRTTTPFLIQGNASSTFTSTNGGNTTTVGFTTPTGTNSISFPDASGTLCTTTASTCSATYQVASATGYLAKNTTDTSSFAVTAANYLYGFTNSSSAVASGVLKLDNGANTGDALLVTASASAASNNALIVANNTLNNATGNLIDLWSTQSTTSASRFAVDTLGNVSQNGGTSTTDTINGQRISSAANFTGTVTAATSVLTPLLDTASSGVLSVGTNNATEIDLKQTTRVEPSGDSLTTPSFGVLTSGGNNLLTVASDTTHTRVGINLGGSNLPTISGSGLEILGALQLDGGATPEDNDNFTTPAGSTVATKILIPVYNPGNFGQILAFGINSSTAASADGTARAISVFDQRGYTAGSTSNPADYAAFPHQPSITVFSPDENNVGGFSWEGSNSNFYVKTNTNNFNIRLASSTTAGLDAVQVVDNGGSAQVGIGRTPTTYALEVNGSAQATTSLLAPVVDSVSGALAVGSGNATAVNVGSTTNNPSITLNSGTSNISLSTNSSSAGTTVKTATNSATGFQVQNSDGENILAADTTASTNVLVDPEFAQGSGTTLTDWTKLSTPTTWQQNTTAADTYAGQTSLQMVTTTGVGQGIQSTVFNPATPVTSNGGTYTFSIYIMQTGGTALNGNNFEALALGGGSPTSNPCTINGSGTTTLNSGFQQVSCLLTFTSNSGITTIKFRTRGTISNAATLWLSDAQLQTGSAPTPIQLGGVQLKGIVNTPVNLQNSANSSTAFQVQNASNGTELTVDTQNNRVVLGSINSYTGLQGALAFSDGTTDGFTGTVQLAGAIASNQTYSLPTTGGTFCLNTQNCNGVGTGYILNTTTQQTGNFNLISNATNTNTGFLQGAASNTVPVLVAQAGSGASASVNVLEVRDASGVCQFRVSGGSAIGSCNATGASTNSQNNTFRTGDASGSSSNSGQTKLLTGDSTTSGNTGAITIATGTATSGNSGAISIDSGGASGTKGGITIGGTNASSVTAGSTAATLSLQGGSGGATVNATGGNLTLSTTTSGTLALTSAGALNLTGAAASTWSTTSGNLTVDSAAALQLGTSNATSLSIGKTTTTATVQGTLQLGASAGTGAFLNSGSTVNTVYAMSNLATGGWDAGGAAATVDKYTYISANQTTAGQTLTVPAPTANTTYGRLVYISNIGTASFIMLGTTISAGTTATLVWAHANGGDKWTFAGADGSSILNQNASAQTANFYINGSGQADTSFLTPLLDSTSTVHTLDVGTTNATSGIVLHQDTLLSANKSITYSAGSGNFDQHSSTGTLQTGTGNVSLNGNTTVANGKSLNVGSTAGNSSFVNNGSTTNTELAKTDFATGGSIGSAASTVDIYTYISVAQTTTGQTITLPTPTASTTYGKLIYLSNIGTASFSILGTNLLPGSTATLVWANKNGGAAWTFAGADVSNLQAAYNNSAGAAPSIAENTSNKALTVQSSATAGIASGNELFGVRAVAANDTTLGASSLTVSTTGVGIEIGTTGQNPTVGFDLGIGQIAGATTARTIGVLAQGTAATGGNGLTVTAGTGNTSGVGGALSLQGGVGGNAAAGGTAQLLGGASGGGATAGGAVTVQGGASNATAGSNGGAASLLGGNGTSTGTGGVGGSVAVTGGNSFGSNANTGGTVTVQGGQGSPTGAGGAATVQGGSGGTTSGAGGLLTLQGGNATAGTSAGGGVTIVGGTAVGNTNGGNVSVTGGTAASTAGSTGGTVTISGGAGTGTGTGAAGSAVSINGGNAGGSNSNLGGGITLTGGTGSTNGGGGAVTLQGGASAGTGTGGLATLQGGSASATAGSAGGGVAVTGAAGANGAGATAGGAAGAVTLTSGAGGAGTGSNSTGAAAANIVLNGGAGGNATGTGTTGNGGSITLTPGVAGTGGAGGGVAGVINLQAATVATNQATVSLFGATATTVNAFTAATAINVGAANTVVTYGNGGAATVKATGALTVDSVAGLNLGTVNATAVAIGKSTTTTNINGSTQIGTLNTAGTGAFINNGATTNTVDPIGDVAAGGSIGTAASTVDIYTYISVAQTTSGKTLTIPNPTANTTYGKVLYLSNIGTASFGLLSTNLLPGSTATLIWANKNGGAAWTFAGADSSNLQAVYNNSAGAAPSIAENTTNKALTLQVSATTGIGSGNELFGVRAAAANDTTLGASILTVSSTGLGINLGDTGQNPSQTMDLQFGGTANRVIGVTTQATAATAGANLTVQAAAGNTSGTGGNLVLVAGAGGTTGIGGAASLTGGAAGGGNTAGGAATVQGGAASGTAAGGLVTIQGGNAASNASSVGGGVTIAGGTAGATAGSTGGAVTIRGGAGTGTGTGAAGSAVNLNGGAAGGSGNNAGGAIALQGGTATGTAAGGAITLQGGTAASNASSVGGGVTITGGTAGATAGSTGGAVTINGGVGTGTGTGAAGSAVNINGGAAGGSGGNNGGSVAITSGAPTGAGTSGTISITTAAAAATAGSAGGGITVQAAAGTATGTGGNGGSISIVAGNAQGSGANAGGNITLTAGNASSTGVPGVVSIDQPVFTATSLQTYAVDTTVASSLVDQNSTLLVTVSAANKTITIPAPTNTTTGRIYYVTVASGSNSFTLAPTGGPTVNMFANDTAMLVWNGAQWTASASASSLQQAYNNTSSSPASIVTTSSTKNILIQAGVGFDNSNLFQVGNSSGAQLFTVDTTNTASGTTNKSIDGGVESALGTNWQAFGTGASVVRDTTNFASGTGAVAISTTATNPNTGGKNNLGAALTTGTTYIVSFSAKLASGTFTDLDVQYNRDTAVVDKNCSTAGTGSTSTLNTRTLSTSGWLKITCYFTTSGSAGTSNAFLAITSTAGAAHTWYVDNLSIVQQNSTGAQNTADVQVGGIYSQGVTLLTLDSYSNTPWTGTGNTQLLGSMYYDTSVGLIKCYQASGWGTCGAAPNNNVTLVPEYAGAVLNGTGSSNTGTMTANLCANTGTLTGGSAIQPDASLCGSGDLYEFYKWTTTQATAQTYDIYVRSQLPPTFKSFSSTPTVVARVSSTTDGVVTASMYAKDLATGTTDGTLCGTAVTTSSANTWQTLTLNTGSCQFNASDWLLFKVDVSAKNNAFVYASNISWVMTGK